MQRDDRASRGGRAPARVVARAAAAQGAELVVFPELALTTFFPRWDLDDAELLTLLRARDAERRHAAAVRRGAPASASASTSATPSSPTTATATTRPCSSSATARSSPATARCTSPATRSPRRGGRSSTSSAATSSPGPRVPRRRRVRRRGRHAICNDRRWPETYRVLGLQGVELMLIGYNTPIHYAPDPNQDRLAGLPQQPRDGGRRVPERHVGGRRRQGRGGGRRRPRWPRARSSRPSGEVVARRSTSGDEVVVAVVRPRPLRRDTSGTVFDFERYRRPEVYGAITEPR